MNEKILLIVSIVFVLALPAVFANTISQKTTGWFVMSREGTIGAQVNASDNVTIIIPENNINVKNAWVEIEFMEGDKGSAGNATKNIYLNRTLLGGTGTTTWTDREFQRHRLLANATLLYGLPKGNHTFEVTFSSVTGTINQMLSARIYVTYDYNTSSDIQAKTVMFVINNSAANVAAAANYETNFTINLPENNVQVRNAWITMTGITDGGAGSLNLKLNGTTMVRGNLTMSGLGETETYYVVINASSTASNFYSMSGNNPTGYYSFQVNPVTNEVAAPSAIAVITYTYNESASSTLLNTAEFFINSSDTAGLLSATSSSMDGDFEVRIPEKNPVVRSSFLEIGGNMDHGATQPNITVIINGTRPITGNEINMQGSTSSTDELANFNIFIDTNNDAINPYNINGNGNYKFNFTMICQLDDCVGEYAKLFLTYAYDKAISPERLTTNTYWIGNRNLMLSTNQIYRNNFTIRIPFNTTVQSAYIETSFQNEDDVDTTLTMGLNNTPLEYGNNFIDSTALVYDSIMVKKAKATAASLYNITRDNTNYPFEFVFNNSAENTFRLSAKAVVTYNYTVPLPPVITADGITFNSGGLAKTIGTNSSVIVNGSCTVLNTAANLQLYIQDNRTHTFTNTSGAAGAYIYTNRTAYNFTNLLGSTGNMFFNVSVTNITAEYALRIQCAAETAAPSWANSTKVNLTLISDSCTPVGGQDWIVEAGDNCVIEGKNYNVKFVQIKGNTGRFTVRHSNITSTGCAVMPSPGQKIEVYIEKTTLWGNGC